MKPDIAEADRFRLEIFQGDPVLRWLRRRDAPSIFLLSVPIVLMGLIIACAAGDHSLAQPNLREHFCHDFAGILPARPEWSCLKGANSIDSTISFFRDFPSIIAILVVGITPYLIYRHWLAIEDLFPSMVKDRLVVFSNSSERDAFLEEIKRTNTYFTKLASLGGIFGLIAATFGLPLLEAERFGVYPSFMMSQDTGQATKLDYSAWWASYNHGLGWTAYYLTVLAAGYFTILMNAYGFRPVVLLWRTRKIVTFEASEDLPSDYFGWRRPREILAVTYISTVLFGVVLLCLSTTLSNRVLSGIFPFFAVWAFVLPFYVSVPIYVTVKSVRAYRTKTAVEIRNRLVELRDDTTAPAIAEKNELSTRLQRVQSIRALPFKAKEFVVATLTAVVGAATLYGALALWYRIY